MKTKISDAGKREIEKAVDQVFENTAREFLGYIPGDQKKTMMFMSKRPSFSLADLYVKAMQQKQPNSTERETLKGLIRIAYGFIAGLKEKTKAQVLSRVDSLVRDSKTKPKSEEIASAIQEEMDKARSHMKMIAETESTKVRNTGSAMDIIRVGASTGQSDPNVFFIVKRDEHTCQHCINNHLHPDGTPRVFKLSEVKTSYLTKEERSAGAVSLSGLHPHCRCGLSILSPGFGFKDGKITWIGLGHDEHARQRS